MIELKNVSKKYGDFLAVNNISFNIDDGEIIGLLGPNGAGKSSIMNMITGFIDATSGEIIVDNDNIEKKPKVAKSKIGYMPEGVPLYMDLTPFEFVSFMSELRGVSKKDRKYAVNKALEATKISEVKNQLIKTLSRGYKQRVSMAGAIVGEPPILIFDEPTVGLDPKQILEIRELIKELGKTHTVIFSSHILSEVSQICKKVIIINKGEVVAIDTPENLESKMTTSNSVMVISDPLEDKMDKVKEILFDVDEISLVKENDDGTKQYIITTPKDIDLRKQIFDCFSSIKITILEMKKVESSLEDAFIKLISADKADIKEEEGEE